MHFDKNAKGFYTECRITDELTGTSQLQIVVITAEDEKEAVRVFDTITSRENSIRKRLRNPPHELTLNRLSDGLKEICNLLCYRFPDNVYTADNKDGFGCYGRFYRYTPSLLILIISKVHNLQSVKTEKEKDKIKKAVANLFEE